MAADWTGQVPDPSLGPPQPTHGRTLKEYADVLMDTLVEVKRTQVKLELHGKVLVLREKSTDRVYAIGVIDNAD